nr:hypothetical protein [Tanacetum cinerariifolium]
MDQKLKGYDIKNAANKRRFENNSRDNHGQQQPPFKRQNVNGQYVVRAYTVGNNVKRKANKTWNKTGNKEANSRAYAIGGGGANPDSNVVTDVSYAVELADGRILETNVILKGCTLGLLGHPFNIDLMPIELDSFDVIIGDGCNGRSKSKMTIISCTKTQKYIQKGCQVYLAQVMAKKTDDKSEEKRLKDMPIVHDFP